MHVDDYPFIQQNLLGYNEIHTYYKTIMMNQIMHDVIYQTKENIQMYTNPLRDTIQQIRRDIEMPDLAKNPFGLRVTIFESEENAVDLDDVCR